eukprot:5202184-Lingulodinium_polyedra.AAC.1
MSSQMVRRLQPALCAQRVSSSSAALAHDTAKADGAGDSGVTGPVECSTGPVTAASPDPSN